MNTREQIRQAQSGTSAPKAVEPKVPAPTNGQAPANAEAEVKAPKTPKAPKVAQPCKCNVPDVKGTNGGCAGGLTKGVFAPGHDAKLTGYLTREVVAGNLTTDAAVADLAGKGGSALLQNKLRAAIERETDKATKREAAAKQREEAKAAKETALEEARAQAEKAKEELAAKREQG